AVESRGLVNIAVTGALRRAGYVRPWPAPWSPAEPPAEPAPVPPLTEALEVRRGHARLAPGVAVDFGGIAKGLWADDAVARLGPQSVVGLGGDVAARGDGPTGDGWPIGLPNGRTLVLHDGGVATSGTTKRASGGAHHLIDPRTGLPARSGLSEVTVVAGCAAAAEWVATAVLVDGPGSPARHGRGVVACFTTPEATGADRGD